MTIGLVDVDGHNFPNFAIMKIAAYHKSKGDSVEWALPMFGEYDRVYQSKIFTFTPDEQPDWHCEVVKGGTGYDIRSRLADEVEASSADGLFYISSIPVFDPILFSWLHTPVSVLSCA